MLAMFSYVLCSSLAPSRSSKWTNSRVGGKVWWRVGWGNRLVNREILTFLKGLLLIGTVVFRTCFSGILQFKHYRPQTEPTLSLPFPHPCLFPHLRFPVSKTAFADHLLQERLVYAWSKEWGHNRCERCLLVSCISCRSPTTCSHHPSPSSGQTSAVSVRSPSGGQTERNAVTPSGSSPSKRLHATSGETTFKW